MNIYEVKNRTELLINELVNLWEDSVRNTYLFLSNEEIKTIKKYVPKAIHQVQHLLILEEQPNIPLAFMGINDNKLEMLFVKNSERGKGLGTSLLRYGITNFKINELVVNEQNPNARKFYEQFGFKIYKISSIDEQGSPYPIFYMRLEKEK